MAVGRRISVGSTAKRGSREKTITLLLKTWVRVPKPLQPLRDEGTTLLQGVRRSERLPFHWGMTMAVYPFWRLVAEVTGRLFRLQGTVTPRQVQGRVIHAIGSVLSEQLFAALRQEGGAGNNLTANYVKKLKRLTAESWRKQGT